MKYFSTQLSSKRLILLIILIVSMSLFWLYGGRGQRKTEDIDLVRIRKEIASHMVSMDSVKAFAKVKADYAGAHFNNQHLVAHVFGELLYKKDGIAGITVCDESFAFGCYHSFFGAAIAHRGLSVVTELDRVCVEKFGIQGLGCPHGIGHGLGEHLGPEKLVDQLEICKTLSWHGTYFGCVGGVFMEYHFPTMVGAATATTSTRAFDANDPYDPCPRVPAHARRACYLELPSWWEDVLSQDYQRMGELCAAVADPLEEESCFLGIGYSAGPRHNYVVETVKSICSRMPDRDGEILCRAGASWSLFASPEHRESARALCSDISPSEAARCETSSDLLRF